MWSHCGSGSSPSGVVVMVRSSQNSPFPLYVYSEPSIVMKWGSPYPVAEVLDAVRNLGCCAFGHEQQSDTCLFWGRVGVSLFFFHEYKLARQNFIHMSTHRVLESGRWSSRVLVWLP